MAFDQYNNEELLISLIHAWTKLFEIAKHVLILVKEF